MPKTTRSQANPIAAQLSTLRRAEHLLAEAEELGHMGAWEFDIDTQAQAWTDGVRKIHEVAGDYQPSVADGIAFYTPASRPVITTAKGNLRTVRAIGARDPS